MIIRGIVQNKELGLLAKIEGVVRTRPIDDDKNNEIIPNDESDSGIQTDVVITEEEFQALTEPSDIDADREEMESLMKVVGIEASRKIISQFCNEFKAICEDHIYPRIERECGSENEVYIRDHLSSSLYHTLNGELENEIFTAKDIISMNMYVEAANGTYVTSTGFVRFIELNWTGWEDEMLRRLTKRDGSRNLSEDEINIIMEEIGDIIRRPDREDDFDVDELYDYRCDLRDYAEELYNAGHLIEIPEYDPGHPVNVEELAAMVSEQI